jgi:hypothetical protein
LNWVRAQICRGPETAAASSRKITVKAPDLIVEWDHFSKYDVRDHIDLTVTDANIEFFAGHLKRPPKISRTPAAFLTTLVSTI